LYVSGSLSGVCAVGWTGQPHHTGCCSWKWNWNWHDVRNFLIIQSLFYIVWGCECVLWMRFSTDSHCAKSLQRYVQLYIC